MGQKGKEQHKDDSQMFGLSNGATVLPLTNLFQSAGREQTGRRTLFWARDA